MEQRTLKVGDRIKSVTFVGVNIWIVKRLTKTFAEAELEGYPNSKVKFELLVTSEGGLWLKKSEKYSTTEWSLIS